MLLASELNSNKILGPVAAIGIVFALLGALTLLPALLLWAGRVAFWPVRPKVAAHTAADDEIATKGVWPWVARLVARRPRLIWIVSTLSWSCSALGVTQLKADGVPTSEFVLGESQARDGQADRSASTSRAAPAPRPSSSRPRTSLQEVADIVLGTDGVSDVSVLSEDSPSGSLPVTDGRHPAARPSRNPGRRADRRRRAGAAERHARLRQRLRRGRGRRGRPARAARGGRDGGDHRCSSAAPPRSRSTPRTRPSTTATSSSRWCSGSSC